MCISVHPIRDRSARQRRAVFFYVRDVFYETDSVKQLHFSGHLGRYKEIRDILDAITEATGVKFSIKERIIIVTK